MNSQIYNKTLILRAVSLFGIVGTAPATANNPRIKCNVNQGIVARFDYEYVLKYDSVGDKNT